MRTILVIPNLKFYKNYLYILRSAEALGVTELNIMKGINFRKVPKGTMKAHRHIKKIYFNALEEITNYLIKEKVRIICVENIPNATPLNKFVFPPNCAIVMGHENLGVPKEFINYYQSVIIPQYGLVRCLNTTVAMSIVLWERFKQGLRI
jgi:tRNA G18 (ribose-2'-O)-methylase SpoU